MSLRQDAAMDFACNPYAMYSDPFVADSRESKRDKKNMEVDRSQMTQLYAKDGRLKKLKARTEGREGSPARLTMPKEMNRRRNSSVVMVPSHRIAGQTQPGSDGGTPHERLRRNSASALRIGRVSEEEPGGSGTQEPAQEGGGSYAHLVNARDQIAGQVLAPASGITSPNALGKISRKAPQAIRDFFEPYLRPWHGGGDATRPETSDRNSDGGGSFKSDGGASYKFGEGSWRGERAERGSTDPAEMFGRLEINVTADEVGTSPTASSLGASPQLKGWGGRSGPTSPRRRARVRKAREDDPDGEARDGGGDAAEPVSAGGSEGTSVVIRSARLMRQQSGSDAGDAIPEGSDIIRTGTPPLGPGIGGMVRGFGRKARSFSAGPSRQFQGGGDASVSRPDDSGSQAVKLDGARGGDGPARIGLGVATRGRDRAAQRATGALDLASPPPPHKKKRDKDNKTGPPALLN